MDPIDSLHVVSHLSKAASLCRFLWVLASSYISWFLDDLMTWFFHASPKLWMVLWLIDVFDDYIGYLSICNRRKVLSYRMAVDPYLSKLLLLTQNSCVWTVWMELTWDLIVCLPSGVALSQIMFRGLQILYYFLSLTIGPMVMLNGNAPTWETKGLILGHDCETMVPTPLIYECASQFCGFSCF